MGKFNFRSRPFSLGGLAALTLVASARTAWGDGVAMPSVDGPSLERVRWGRGTQSTTLLSDGTWDELARTSFPKGVVQVRFPVKVVPGSHLEVPPCAGRRTVWIDGKRVLNEQELSGPWVGPLGTSTSSPTEVEVRIDVAVSSYEKRVACGYAPRVGTLRTAGRFVRWDFASPAKTHGGGTAVVVMPTASREDGGTPTSWPLLVGLHPWNGSVWTYTAYGDLLAEADRQGVVLLFPSGLGNSLYTREAEQEVMTALQTVSAHVPIDGRRIALWGASMGGAGATTIGFHRPDRFASVTSFFGDSEYDLGTYVRSILKSPLEARLVNSLPIADNARHVPVWLVHGDADRVSPMIQSTRLDEALRRRGYPVRFDAVAGAGHEGSLVTRYARDLVTLARTKVRPDFPTRVTYRSVRPEDGAAYGLRWVKVKSGDAFVDVEAKEGTLWVEAAENIARLIVAPEAFGGVFRAGQPVPVRFPRGVVPFPVECRAPSEP